jgi:hypothetical protein
MYETSQTFCKDFDDDTNDLHGHLQPAIQLWSCIANVCLE